MTVDGVKQIVTLTEKSIVGVNAADGTLRWQIPFVPKMRAYNAATPIIDGQTVIYTGATRGTSAVKISKQGDAFTATPLWSNPDVATQYNSPVLKDGFIYGMSDHGNLFCLDAQTGKTAWLDTVQRDRGGFATTIDAGSVMFTLPSNSKLIVYKPDEKAYTELTQITVADTPTFAYPIVAGNRIFVKDKDAITLWNIE